MRRGNREGKQMAELVSVVLPTFNRAPTLGRAIRSVLAQTYRDIELIVIDDGSTDNTPAVIQAFSADSRLRYQPQKNAGAAVARNTGLALARGQWIAFQDSDDEWLPEKIAAQIAAAGSSKGKAAVIYSDMMRVSASGEESLAPAPTVRHGPIINPLTMDYLVFGLGIVSALILREALHAIEGFDENLPRFIDLDLFTRLAVSYEFVRVSKPLVRYHATEGITSNPAALAKAREYLLKKYHAYFMSRPKERAHQYIRIAEAYWKMHSTEPTRKYCRMALETYPYDWRVLTKSLLIRLAPSAIVARLPQVLRSPLQ
jgi:glycosyltransferase involved in cell wall biosynthesis